MVPHSDDGVIAPLNQIDEIGLRNPERSVAMGHVAAFAKPWSGGPGGSAAVLTAVIALGHR